MKILNPNYEITYLEYPYPVWVIDNFMRDDVLSILLEKWPESDHKNWHKGHEKISGKPNILEQGMRGISKIEMMPEEIGDIVKELHSQEFTNVIGKMLSMEGLISDDHMRWSGLRTMLSDSFQLIHSDARISPESGLRKELTCLLYLNPNYEKERDQGCLEIWNDDMTQKVHEIEPILNRMTIFLNSDKSFHGVPLVKRERRAITFSILKKGEVGERSKALFVARPDDPEEVTIEGVNRSIMKDAKGY